MSDKKIAIVTPAFLPYRGGMCVVAQQDAEQLASLKYEVDVFVPGAGQPLGKGGYGVRGLHSWFRYGNAAWVPWVGRACKDYDVVVLHYPFFGGAEPLAWSKFRGKIGKLIIYYHMDVVGKGPLSVVFKTHGALVRPRVINSADRILVTSFDYARSSAIENIALSEPSRLRELPPAVDIERFSPGAKSGALMERYGLDTSKPIIAFVGGLDKAHYFKGVDVLIRALAVTGLENAQAIVVGEGELKDEYKKLAADLGLSDRVKFAGAVSDEELPDHYRLADIFAFPSIDRSEAFGIAALEAMSCGVPVVASDLVGVRTIVREGETGFLVKPGSVSALAARLSDILKDNRHRKELGDAGRNMAIEEYSDSRRAEKWGRVIDEIMKGR
ncbi:MAG: glycosyltransferase family 4 protein [Patescibacteria group bacterium]|nr:glycosyltransferase family 4 protein [Patescibacteria group bacterium]